MREILFRGKTESGQWVYGDFAHPCHIVFTSIGFDEVLNQENVPIVNEELVVPETVGQYTGLTDKNGKKIFEGDIVKFTDRYKSIDNKEQSGIAKIEFLNCKFMYLGCYDRGNPGVWLSLSDSSVKFEVIGNIHDNPELLEEKQ